MEKQRQEDLEGGRIPLCTAPSSTTGGAATMPKIQSGCLPYGFGRSQSRVRRRKDAARAETELSEVTDGSVEVCSPIKGGGGESSLEHLVIMVNGIVGSASNWKFAAERFSEAMGERVLIHCSTCNSSTLTFHGVDVMGKRLADEVQEVVDRVQGMKKISFVSHSLGGLVSRYAIARLFKPADPGLKRLDEDANESFMTQRGTIAGLQPINFITVATPHLGSRGHKQLPFLNGFRCLEKIAMCIGHWFVGRTGRHLFLTDGRRGRAPLLLRMVSDCEDGMFLSALQSFKRRVAYANIDCDSMVGWGTSSLRRESELPKVKPSRPADPKYPHIFSVEHIFSSEKVHPENGNEARQLSSPVSEKSYTSISDACEEEMLSALTSFSWERVDVSFSESAQSYFAHNIIQVKSYPLHAEGQDVIQHMIDHFLH